MKIAIVSNYNFHLECIGFLLELLDECDIYIQNDKFKYLDYFKLTYNFKTYILNVLNESKYDYIIKLTSNDPIYLNISKDKIISILHLSNKEYNLNKFITLSKNVYTKKEFIYIFPYYKTNNIGNYNSKTIIFIGNLLNDMVTKDFINFICKIHYKIILAVSHIDLYIKNLLHKLKSNNLTIIININSIALSNLLKNCSFILIRNYEKYNDRFSGGISIGISNKIPIICNNKLIKNTKIPFIKFNNNYMEIIDYINSITKEKYEIEIKKINKFIKHIQIENKKNINFLF